MISATAEYALRAASCLARAPEGRALLGRELSILAAVPSSYLAKILLELKRAGIVTATRGSGGGYQLAKPPGDVRLADVVEVFDGSAGAPRCLLGQGRECSPEAPCALHWKWSRVRRTFALFLETTTLAEVLPASPEAAGVPEPTSEAVADPGDGLDEETTTPATGEVPDA